jgi:hypothetical protein
MFWTKCSPDMQVSVSCRVPISPLVRGPHLQTLCFLSQILSLPAHLWWLLLHSLKNWALITEKINKHNIKEVTMWLKETPQHLLVIIFLENVCAVLFNLVIFQKFINNFLCCQVILRCYIRKKSIVFVEHKKWCMYPVSLCKGDFRQGMDFKNQESLKK